MRKKMKIDIYSKKIIITQKKNFMQILYDGSSIKLKNHTLT